MNILFVNSIPFNPIGGGIERVTDILTKELQKRGYCVYYLCGYVDESHEQILDYDFPAKLYLLPQKGLFDSNENLIFYEKLLYKLNIDIVINQRGIGGGFNPLLSIGNVKKISVLHSKPDAILDYQIARILLFSNEFKEQLKKWVKILLYPFFYYKVRFLVKRSLEKAYNELTLYTDAIVLLSDKDIDKFLMLGTKIDHKKIYGIPNPNTFFVENNINFEKKDKVILFVGRLDQFGKNVLCLVKVWQRLYLKYPDWKLVIVGDGPDKQRLINFIRDKNIQNIYMEGLQKDVSKYYRKASFVCLTSFYEGWGMALTEGMAFGCIPLTFNNYGAAFDIIDDDINGCLIEYNNVKEYSVRLAELMSDDAKRIKMGKAALEKVKKFSVENVTKKWEALFLKLINDSKI